MSQHISLDRRTPAGEKKFTCFLRSLEENTALAGLIDKVDVWWGEGEGWPLGEVARRFLGVIGRGENGVGLGEKGEVKRLDFICGRSEFWRKSYRDNVSEGQEGGRGKNAGRWGALLGPVSEVEWRGTDGFLKEVEREVARLG